MLGGGVGWGWKLLSPPCRRLRTVAADENAYRSSFVAASRFDAFFEESLQPWDVLAGGLIVEEAGGRVSDFDGASIGLQGAQVLASNGRLHEAMLALLREDAPALAKPRPAVV